MLGFRRTGRRAIRSAISNWRDSLINLTGSNPLLNFKPSKTGMIGMVRPSPSDVLSRISLVGPISFGPSSRGAP